jgi:lysophospholipase L1-like esterase
MAFHRAVEGQNPRRRPRPRGRPRDDPITHFGRKDIMGRSAILTETPLALALAPVLLVQAAWAMARTPRLPEPAGPRSGAEGQGAVLRLLVVGDSSAAGVGVPTQDAALTGRLVAALSPRHRVEWHLVARSGATTAETRAMLAQTDLRPVDVAVTALGVNDVKNGVDLRVWLDATHALHADLRDRIGAHRIIASGLPSLGDFPALPRPLGTVLHRRAQRFEAALVADLAARDSDVVHLPFDLQMTPEIMASDGFHPGPVIYAEWAKRVAACIATDLAPAPVPAPSQRGDKAPDRRSA